MLPLVPLAALAFADPIVLEHRVGSAPRPPPRATRAPTPAWAPGSPPGRWSDAALPVTFVLGSPASRDLGVEAGAELDVALRTWTLPACTGFRARHAGIATGAVAADDGVNVVLVHDEAWPDELVPGAIAQTVVHLDASGFVHDADIHLNAVDWRFSLDGAPGTLDARSVLVHELGHALGLGHSAEARATMAPNGSGLRWRSLEADDVAGLCALYPGRSGDGCDAEPCPGGYVCVARRCQRRATATRPGDRDDVCAPCDPETANACEAAGDDARCIDVAGDDGATSGRACGRACAVDDDCGAGFSCRPTTAAGDLQCVSRDGCRSAAAPCEVDADCVRDAVCVRGACLGRVPQPTSDGGPPHDAGGEDAGAGPAPSPAIEASGGGCACESTRTSRAGAPSFPLTSAALATAAALLASVVRRVRRPRDVG